ncbi:carbohydrate kinase family protein [Sciscionella sediminilitoris]|uniref:carbohydrate kinase family protein n=1 Tax=Sciscionella sediminilitoris TaxID=1445613 RepID=UPI0004DF6CA5|nr:carbohydrate kinase family protein [Sciscionella sp. SE31]
MTALFVGDTVFDTTIRVGHLPAADEKVVAAELADSIGGVVTNAAVACRRTGQPTRLVTAIGTDTASAECLAQGRELGIEFCPETLTGPANRAIIALAGDGEKQLMLAPGVRMYPSARRCADLSLEDVGWVHTAVYEPEAARVLLARCAESGVPWSIDLEPATFPSGITELAAQLDGAAVVFCNTRAAQAIGPDPLEVLLGMGVRAVVFTDGARGARWCTRTERFSVPAPADAPPIVDTTGAGDCLAGSFIGLYGESGDPKAALDYAVRAASRSCAVFGGHRSYASREELS